MSLKFCAALGFCAKAGKLQSGDFAVTRAVRDRKARAIIIDTEASEQTKKKWRNSCEFYKIPIFETVSPGKNAGKPDKIVFAVTDDSFCSMIAEAYEAEALSEFEDTDN